MESYDNVYLEVDFDILKFNEVLGAEDSCYNPADDVEVFCAKEFGQENVHNDTICEVPLNLLTKEYFVDHVSFFCFLSE